MKRARSRTCDIASVSMAQGSSRKTKWLSDLTSIKSGKKIIKFMNLEIFHPRPPFFLVCALLHYRSTSHKSIMFEKVNINNCDIGRAIVTLGVNLAEKIQIRTYYWCLTTIMRCRKQIIIVATTYCFTTIFYSLDDYLWRDNNNYY